MNLFLQKEELTSQGTMSLTPSRTLRLPSRLLAVLGLLVTTSVVNAQSSGSGFFVSSQGHVVTNFHVIADSDIINIRTKNGQSYAATVIRIDAANDLAVLKINKQTPFIPIASSSEIKKGERVFTMGFPLASLQGEQESKITDGLVSSLSGILGQPNNFQISVPLQPGNSGGPLISSSGAVVGVVVAKLNAKLALEMSGTLPENVNYAVKSNYLIEILDIAEIPYQRIVHSQAKSVPVNKLAEIVDNSIVFITGLTASSRNEQQVSSDVAPNVQARPDRSAAPKSHYEIAFVDALRLKNQTNLGAETLNRQILEYSERFKIDIVFQKAVWASKDRDLTDRFVAFVKDGRFPEKPYLDYGLPSKLGFVNTSRILELKAQWKGPLGIFSTDNQKQESLIRAANTRIISYAENNGYDLIFQEAVYANHAMDLTDEIIRSLKMEMSK